MKVPPAWVMVSIGLLLNIMAIVISGQVLDKMMQETSALHDEKGGNLYSIQLAWNQVETIERKREAILTHLQLKALTSNSSSDIDQVWVAQLKTWGVDGISHVDVMNVDTLMVAMDKAQQGQRNVIDDLYLKNLTITESITQIDEQMALYKNIALFLQIFGLALILARDLSRR
ncbi:DNA mismatch repair protein [Vibrio sp. ZSDZ34]|uniref:DNA mismatch repair protein n=1 Tax=Vibrio gelatinilyticus TaxID=2893468 RepID=A0A9X1W9R4_9VIBR|nr:DNA mismatch repair protein [Vibrio gelatinilyticus]MCJ2376982.1 DNA mismatch repair protein [Vibrio gelatinilyticus]